MNLKLINITKYYTTSSKKGSANIFIEKNSRSFYPIKSGEILNEEIKQKIKETVIFNYENPYPLKNPYSPQLFIVRQKTLKMIDVAKTKNPKTMIVYHYRYEKE